VSDVGAQGSLFEDGSPASQWERDVARRSLDELFTLTHQYRSSKAYRELLEFVGRFRFYAPFNAMLVHIQMPGARYVAPPARWLREHSRRIRAGARPLVILQPMRPVMFVFDVTDTEPEKSAPPLPPEVEQPFEVRGGRIGGELARTIENAKRDGVDVAQREAGSQSAGQIRVTRAGRHLTVQAKAEPNPEYVTVPLRYELLLNSKHSEAAKYATVAHELGHLYCGHLGTPNDKWWPDRRGLSHEVCEFEAKSVCYLVCARLGIDNPSETYLGGYLRDNVETPVISLDCIMKAAGFVEQMGRGRLKPRKEKE
jgi:hypothetical protein